MFRTCSRTAAEITGNDEANVTAQGSQQRRFVDHVREHEEQERKKRNDGQQEVIGERSREQQALVLLEGLQDPQGKVPGLGHDLPPGICRARHSGSFLSLKTAGRGFRSHSALFTCAGVMALPLFAVLDAKL